MLTILDVTVIFKIQTFKDSIIPRYFLSSLDDERGGQDRTGQVEAPN